MSKEFRSGFLLGLFVLVLVLLALAGGAWAYRSATTFEVGQEKLPIEGLAETIEPQDTKKGK